MIEFVSKWFMGSSRTKADRQFEILDGRLRDVQGRLKLLSRKVDQKMSELTDAVQAVVDDVKRVGDGVDKVLALLTQPNPDVAAAVEQLKAVDAGFDSIAEKLEAVGTTPTPTEG